jgi:TonB family protein
MRMIRPLVGPRWLALLLVVPTLASAQVAFVVQHEGKPRLVRNVRRGFCFIEKNGKLQDVSRESPVALVPVSEFLPFFVSVRDFRVNGRYVDLSTSEVGTVAVNQLLEFRGTFEAAHALENVYAVVEFFPEGAGRKLFFQEIGALAPRQPQRVSVRLALAEGMRPGKFKLHLFSDGGELLHSQQPAGYRDAQMRKVIAHRIKEVQDARVRVFVGPVPEYPAELREKKLAGEAVVRLRVTPRGEPMELVVKSASAPAFGEAALAAARLCWFLPEVRGGQPVETEVELPFKFAAPADVSS